MIFDSKQFLDQFRIRYFDRGKNISAGWIGIQCPFCADKSQHGGFNLTKGYYRCWRCGYHSLPDIVMELTGCDFVTAKTYIKKYQDLPLIEQTDNDGYSSQTTLSKILSLPPQSHPLDDIHKKYLLSRNFDPNELIHEWGLLGTGPIGDYKFRIITPIHFKMQLVSYQGRDCTGQARLPYKACEKSEEIVHHKHTLYGIDKVKGSSVIVVEGIVDVWRLGPGSVCTFGIEYTQSQIRMLKDKFDSFYIFFDNEDQAQLQAEKLAFILDGFKKDVELIKSKSDPGDLQQKYARQLKQNLLTN